MPYYKIWNPEKAANCFGNSKPSDHYNNVYNLLLDEYKDKSVCSSVIETDDIEGIMTAIINETDISMVYSEVFMVVTFDKDEVSDIYNANISGKLIDVCITYNKIELLNILNTLKSLNLPYKDLFIKRGGYKFTEVSEYLENIGI